MAETSFGLVGFVSAYRIPDKPETLFIWQVAVSKLARGQGLAYQMIKEILKRINSQAITHAQITHPKITHIETSITQDNAASWAMFTSLARQLNAKIETRILFDENIHFKGSHPSEHLLRIGPVHL